MGITGAVKTLGAEPGTQTVLPKCGVSTVRLMAQSPRLPLISSVAWGTHLTDGPHLGNRDTNELAHGLVVGGIQDPHSVRIGYSYYLYYLLGNHTA